MGERTAFMVQANRTADCAMRQPRICSTQISVNSRRAVSKSVSILPSSRFCNSRGAFVVQGAARHVQRLDLVRRRGADGLVIVFADQEIILHHLAQRRQRQQHLAVRRAVFQRDVQHQPVFLQPQGQVIGAAGRAFQPEDVVFQQVVDGDFAFLLDGAAAVHHAVLVQRDGGEAKVHQVLRFSRAAMERACACRPSASASIMASGPRAAMAAGIQRQQRGALHEIQHRQAGGEARRARGGQHMVGPGDIIAHGFGRVAAQEDRAGMAHLLRRSFRDRRWRFPDARARSGRTAAAASSSFSTTMMPP